MNDVIAPSILDQLPDLTWEEKLAYLTVQFLKLPQASCPVEHIFEPGVYIREMRIPAGALFIGRAHHHGHLCELVSGEVIHITDTNKRRISAPFSIHTTPGYHMVFQAVTDVIGRTHHPNGAESRDTQALEDDIFESVEALKELGAAVEARMEQECLA